MTSYSRGYRYVNNLWYPIATPTGIRDMKYYLGFIWEADGTPFGATDSLIIREIPEWLKARMDKINLPHGKGTT